MQKEKWINISKAVAIMAVMIDHIHGILYDSYNVLYASFFSVSLFVLLMGVTSYWSYDNSENKIGSKVRENTGCDLPICCCNYRLWYDFCKSI